MKMIILHMYATCTMHKSISNTSRTRRQVSFSQGRTFSSFAYRVAVAVPGTPPLFHGTSPPDAAMLLTSHAKLTCNGLGIRGYLAHNRLVAGWFSHTFC